MRAPRRVILVAFLCALVWLMWCARLGFGAGTTAAEPPASGMTRPSAPSAPLGSDGGDPAEAAARNTLQGNETGMGDVGSGVDPMRELVRMGQALAIVVVLMVLAIAALKRFQGARGRMSWLEAVAGKLGDRPRDDGRITVKRSQPLPGGGVLHVVEVDGRKLLIGATAQNVSVLTELDGGDASGGNDLGVIDASPSPGHAAAAVGTFRIDGGTTGIAAEMQPGDAGTKGGIARLSEVGVRRGSVRRKARGGASDLGRRRAGGTGRVDTARRGGTAASAQRTAGAPSDGMSAKRPARYFMWLAVLFLLALTLLEAHAAPGRAAPLGIPAIPGVAPAKDPRQVANTVQMLALVTVASLAPALLIMTTAFTRIIIVLSFLRSAIGTQNIPPNQIVFGLAVFLTFFVMNPTFQKIDHNAIRPYMAGKMTLSSAVERGEIPLRRFMVHQTYNADLKLFLKISKTTVKKDVNKQFPEDGLPMQVVIPAFVISELKTGFIFGFLIYIPFVVIDLIVSSLLMSMGMMMLPPTVISLPAKVLVFILADGWHAIAGSLVASYRP